VSDDTVIAPLAAGIQALEADGRSDEEIAEWLWERTRNFGASGKALALARNLEPSVAWDELRATEAWQRVEMRFRIVTASGRNLGEYRSVNGRTFVVGDPLDFMRGPCRVLAVEVDDDPRITARLRVG
jgi:hypothetical protein